MRRNVGHSFLMGLFVVWALGWIPVSFVINALVRGVRCLWGERPRRQWEPVENMRERRR